MRHCYSTELFALEAIFLFHFFEKDLNFWGILSVPHLADIYAKNMDERGRNFVRTNITETLVTCAGYNDL